MFFCIDTLLQLLSIFAYFKNSLHLHFMIDAKLSEMTTRKKVKQTKKLTYLFIKMNCISSFEFQALGWLLEVIYRCKHTFPIAVKNSFGRTFLAA